MAELPVLPKILKCKPLDRISFSSFIDMKRCLVKGLPYNCITFLPTSPHFPKSRPQLVGIFLHTMLAKIPELRKYGPSERAIRIKSEFDRQLLKFCKDYSEPPWGQSLGSIGKWPEMGVIFDQISQVALSERKPDRGMVAEKRVIPEKPLSSKDKLLFGVVDVLIEDGEERIIVEHKMSTILDNGLLNRRHYLQVHFYAELAKEEFGTYPAWLVVRGANGEYQKMRPNISAAKKIGRDARVLLGLYNFKVNLGQPIGDIANASVEACAGCRYQAYCPAFWSECDRLRMPKSIQSLYVKEVELIEGRSAHKRALKVRINKGFLNGMDLVIDGFYPKRFKNYMPKPGRDLVITDLIVDYQNTSGCFTETSQIFTFAIEE